MEGKRKMMPKKYYKNETLPYLYDCNGWIIAANDIEHAMGLAFNRSGVKPDIEDFVLIGTNVTCILKECDTYFEATGLKDE